MDITGMTKELTVDCRKLLFCNQKSPDWTHPYEYEHNGSDLSVAGCGIFAFVHAIEWMHGIRLDPNFVAEVSVAVGGRGDDGTDRPAMLQGMMDAGWGEKWGFRYDGDGLMNDHDALWRHMTGGGTALCNLRVGHIVALLDAKEAGGKRQYLVIDSVAESNHEKVRDHVLSVVPGTAVSYPVRSGSRLVTGYCESWAMFWVDAFLPADFTLIHSRPVRDHD